MPALYSGGCLGRAWRDFKAAVAPRLVEPAADSFTMCKITMVRRLSRSRTVRRIGVL